MCISLVFVLVYNYIPNFYNILLIVLWICYIGSYIQGNYLITHLPMLDGENIQWKDYPMDRFLSVLVWVVVCICVFMVIKHFGYSVFYTCVKMSSVFITLILSITLFTLCISKKGLDVKSTICVTDKKLSTYSTDTNFIIFTLDSVNAEDLKELLESEKYGEKYAENLFEDFTFYYNMMGGYPFTGNSTAFLISGEWYENQIPSNEYFHDAYVNSKLFQVLADNSYELGLYYDGLPSLNSDYYKFVNIMDSKKQNLFTLDFINRINRLTALKYLPFELKPFVTKNMNEFNTSSYLQLLVPQEENCSVFSPDNSLFYSHLVNNEITYSSNKMFK